MDPFWTTISQTPYLLLRTDLCRAAHDPKFSGAETPVYVPEQDRAAALASLSMPEKARFFDPTSGDRWFYGIEAVHGLLYLPFPYLVPGGRFNEMYGWDTAFPVFAWAEEHPKTMREQVDNQLYQIRMYGKVLNAARTYYLSRSHPPLLGRMAMRVWEAAQGRDWSDFDPAGLYKNARDWLEQARTGLEAYHAYWTTGDLLADGGPLSRYWDDGDLPAPEVVASEPGFFEHARQYYSRGGLPAQDAKDKALFYNAETGQLTRLYHRANRAMRASGFDPTAHWGYGALRCIFHAPICLNSLLYRMEDDMARICAILSLPHEEQAWRDRQALRKTAIRDLMFDPQTGLYNGYDFMRGQRNEKIFATVFYAMWAGLYDGDPETARRGAERALKALETPYGLSTSDEISGSQWDHPYGWPPLQYFAIAGLARCGLAEDARRLAHKYLDLARRVFLERGALFEKYNIAEGSAEIHVVHGYHENVTENGTFLWTAATLKMAQDFLKNGVIP